ANASGDSAALSRASVYGRRNIRRPGHDAAPSKTTRPARHHHDRRLRERNPRRPRPRRSAVDGLPPKSGIAWDEVCASMSLLLHRSPKHDRKTPSGSAAITTAASNGLVLDG